MFEAVSVFSKDAHASRKNLLMIRLVLLMLQEFDSCKQHP